MTLNYDDGDGWQATDANQLADRWQFSVKSGCSVSPGTNDLTVQCASGEVLHAGSTLSVSAQDNVSLQSADSSYPRKDTIYLDSTGTLSVVTGTAESPVPSDAVRDQTYRPAPPDLSGTDAVVLAEVWVPAGANDITTTDVRDRRQLSDLAVQSLTSEDLTVTDNATGTGTPDTIVESTSDLESAFTNLSAGEHVYIKTPSTPYRTSQWLDVEASNVRIEAETPYADDGQAIVKPADGANVGGIRVGPGSTTISDVTIKGLGYHGNDLNQDSTVKHLHAVILDNTKDCRVGVCFATRTSPYNEHNSGGSGVSVTSRSSDFWIDNCWFDDIGDRAVQVGGNGGYITRIRSRNGFDRTVSLGLEEDDGTAAAADNIVVNGVAARDNSEGSVVGWGGGGAPLGQYIITNVFARGSYRSAIRCIDNGAVRVNVSNVLSVGSGVGVRIATPDRLKLSNIYSTGQIDLSADRCSLQNVEVVESGGDAVLIDGGSKVYASGIFVDSPGGLGFFNRGADNILVDGLFVRNADTKGLADNDTGTQQRFVNVDIAGSTKEDVNTRGTDTYVSGEWGTVTDSGTRTRLNGIGSESANAETPTPSNWHSGEIVDFTDSGDGSGTDRYIQLPVTFTSDWIRLSDGALV